MFIVFLKKIWYRIYAGLFIKSKAERKKFRKENILHTEQKYLRKYLNVLNNLPQKTPLSDDNRKIWICWFQGIENAPQIVKRCIESIKKNANGCEVVIIDNQNIKKYADIPEYIFIKRQQNLITPMQFSDILRATLLANHGGIWIDATVLLTAPLSQDFIKRDFFCLSSKGIYRNVNWMIGAKAQNPLMIAEKRFLFAYWAKETKLIDYFLYPLAFDFLIDNDKNLSKLWSMVPAVYEDDCYILEKNYFTPYTQTMEQDILQKTSIHKLSYKYDKTKNIEGTFLEKILNNDI